MKSQIKLDRLRIASPCPASWEQMTGDDRARFCELCNLHVYNIAELTASEAKSLIANAEGRICARLYRRSDGTVITKDCPVGLRAIRRRVARIAGEPGRFRHVSDFDGGEDFLDAFRVAAHPAAEPPEDSLENDRQRDDGNDQDGPHDRAAGLEFRDEEVLIELALRSG